MTAFSFDVFLSYSSQDRATVRLVAERLRQAGLRVWFDTWEIHPGDSIPLKIEEGLDNSRVLVLCMSANAFGSDWTQLESSTFRFRDPLNKDRRFVPLRLDDAKTKGSLAQFRYIDWRDPEGLDELVKACSPQPIEQKPEAGHPRPENPPSRVDSAALGIQNAVVVTFGASQYPQKPELSNPSFLRSVEKWAAYLGKAGVPQERILDLYNSNAAPHQHTSAIRAFLSKQRAAAPDAILKVVVYYVGHGYPADGQLIFTLATTEDGNEPASSIRADDLAAALTRIPGQAHLYLILDCCYAGEAVKSFMTDNASSYYRQTMMDHLPNRGVSMLCSSCASALSSAPADETLTMFSGVLLELLAEGAPSLPDTFSFFDLALETEKGIVAKFKQKSIRPVLDSPKKTEGDIAYLEFFPNFARKPQPVLTPASPPQTGGSARRQRFDQDKLKAGVSVQVLEVSWIRARDGKPNVYWHEHALTGLTTTRETIKKYRVFFSTVGGQIAGLHVDKSGRDRAQWHPAKDEKSKAADINARVEALRRIEGLIEFEQAIDIDSVPASFKWHIEVLNLLAESAWDFYQMYTTEESKGIDGADLRNEEYLFTSVSLPIERLVIKVPAPESAHVRPDAFRAQPIETPANPCVDAEGTLDGAVNAKQWRLDRRLLSQLPDPTYSAGLWTWTIDYPPLYSGYALSWDLPDNQLAPTLDQISRQSQQIQQSLMGILPDCRKESPESPFAQAIRKVLESLHDLFAPQYSGRPHAQFDISFMTFDETSKRVVVVDWLLNGRPFQSPDVELRFPVGVGNGGACFKVGRFVRYIEPRRGDRDRFPQSYVPLSLKHGVLVSVPIDHPDFEAHATENPEFVSDRRWQTVGVVNIGSGDFGSPLVAIVDAGDVKQIERFCQVAFDFVLRELLKQPLGQA